VLLGGAVVLVVVGVLVLNHGGAAAAGTGAGVAPAPVAGNAAPSSQPASDKIALAAAKAGKTPARPAPALPASTLQELSDLLGRIKALRNESVDARTSRADVQTARDKMGEAKQLCEQWLGKIQPQLSWQEEAQMDNWAQPAEYATLERLYQTYQRLENEVRRGGG
jgi:hypothetical protein